MQKRDTPSICTEKERVLAETQHTSTHHVFLFTCLFACLVGWLVVVVVFVVVVANAVAVAVVVVAAVVVAVAQQKPVILDALPLASAGVGG